LFVACSQLDIEPNQLGDDLRVLALEASNGGPIVDPVFLNGENNGGNVLCSEAAHYFEVQGGFEFTSPDPEGEGGNEYIGDNKFKDVWPDGFTITVTDNKFVAWSFEPIYIDGVKYCLKDLVVLVKGGPGANAYYYGEGEKSDSGLISPLNPGGNTPDLSNLKLCYNLEPCPEDEPCYDWEGETATGDGHRFARSRNWFMWNDYTTDPIDLIAGQNMKAGTIEMGPVVDDKVTITITLLTDWRFKNVSDAVKVLAYKSAPSSFDGFGRSVRDIKFDKANFSVNKATITVPARDFYFIHVDVEQMVEVECVIE
jgi:hypothetical protein